MFGCIKFNQSTDTNEGRDTENFRVLREQLNSLSNQFQALMTTNQGQQQAQFQTAPMSYSMISQPPAYNASLALPVAASAPPQALNQQKNTIVEMQTKFIKSCECKFINGCFCSKNCGCRERGGCNLNCLCQRSNGDCKNNTYLCM